MKKKKNEKKKKKMDEMIKRLTERKMMKRREKIPSRTKMILYSYHLRTREKRQRSVLVIAILRKLRLTQEVL